MGGMGGGGYVVCMWWLPTIVKGLLKVDLAMGKLGHNGQRNEKQAHSLHSDKWVAIALFDVPFIVTFA